MSDRPDPDLLVIVDRVAAANRLSRAGFISLAVQRACQSPEWKPSE